MDVLTLSKADIQEALSCEEKLRMILAHVPRSDRQEIQDYKTIATDGFSMVYDFVLVYSEMSESGRSIMLDVWFPDYISSLRKAYDAIGRIQNHVSTPYRLETQTHVEFIKTQIGKHIRLFSKLMERQVNHVGKKSARRVQTGNGKGISTRVDDSNPRRIRNDGKKVSVEKERMR